MRHLHRFPVFGFSKTSRTFFSKIWPHKIICKILSWTLEKLVRLTVIFEVLYVCSRLALNNVEVEEQDKIKIVSKIRFERTLSNFWLGHYYEPHKLHPYVTSASLRRPGHCHFVLQGTDKDRLPSSKSSHLVNYLGMILSEWNMSSTNCSARWMQKLPALSYDMLDRAWWSSFDFDGNISI